jgi:taurine transport system substrate-binding protein
MRKGKKLRKTWLVVGLVLVALVTVFCLGSPALAKAKKITVAYFPGWPGTFEYGWAKGWFDKEMGVKVDFREFGSGADMTTAMASGDIAIAYALGTTPFAIAVTQGLPLKMVAISENYSESENLVARGDTTILAPRDLIGKKVGVPFGTTAHYRLMGILETFGLAEKDLKIIDLSNPDILPAFIRKDIDAGCAWEPAVSQMMEKGGRILVSSADQIRWGYSTYGIVAVTEKFAKNNAELLTKFLQVMNKSTVAYHKDPQSTYADIGKMAGITPQKTKDIMSTMGFYDKQTQLSQAWLGTSAKPGQIVKNLKKIGDFLEKQKAIDKSLDDYGKFIDASFMEKVQ